MCMRTQGCACAEPDPSVFPGFGGSSLEGGEGGEGMRIVMWLLDSSVSRIGPIYLVVKDLWKYNAKLPQSRILLFVLHADRG